MKWAFEYLDECGDEQLCRCDSREERDSLMKAYASLGVEIISIVNPE